MIRQDIYIKKYWYIVVLYNVDLGKKDTGFTHTNYDKKLSVVGISKTSSLEEFVNTVSHEIKHVQSHICKYYDIKEDGEQAAYLTGYIAQKMFSRFKKFIYMFK